MYAQSIINYLERCIENTENEEDRHALEILCEEFRSGSHPAPPRSGFDQVLTAVQGPSPMGYNVSVERSIKVMPTSSEDAGMG